jgi:sec-independent protein translocase protein TatA
MPSLGPAEILVILVVALLVFGPNKMPEIAKQVGKGFREFRRVQQHLKSELRDVVSEFDSPSSTASVAQEPVPMLPPKDDDATPSSTSTPTPTPAASEPAASAPALPAADSPTPAASPSPESDAPSEPA